MTILCADDCHVWLGSSSLCTCEAHRVAMLFPGYNPYGPHTTPPTATDLPDVPLSRLEAATLAGAGWLSADGLRIYCERYGETLEAEWKDEGRNFGAWSVVESLPPDAVRME